MMTWLEVAGAATVTAGLALWSPALALVFLGGVMIAAANLAERE